MIPELVREKRRQHPALRSRVTVASLRIIAKRERIMLRYAGLPDGYLGIATRFLGRDAIIVSHRALGEVRRRVLAHELAHIWLGHTSTPGAVLLSIAEDDADTVAARLLRVPRQSFRQFFEDLASSANAGSA